MYAIQAQQLRIAENYRKEMQEYYMEVHRHLSKENPSPDLIPYPPKIGQRFKVPQKPRQPKQFQPTQNIDLGRIGKLGQTLEFDMTTGQVFDKAGNNISTKNLDITDSPPNKKTKTHNDSVASQSSEQSTTNNGDQAESAKHFAKLERVIRPVSAMDIRLDSQTKLNNKRGGQELGSEKQM